MNIRKAPHRIIRKATPEEREKYRKMREKLEEEKPEIIAQGRAWKAAHDAAIGQLKDAFRLLRAERERQGLSLADLQERTGMQRSAICKLENELEGNPKIVTLQRYADALGKQLLIVVADKPTPAARNKKPPAPAGARSPHTAVPFASNRVSPRTTRPNPRQGSTDKPFWVVRIPTGT